MGLNPLYANWLAELCNHVETPLSLDISQRELDFALGTPIYEVDPNEYPAYVRQYQQANRYLSKLPAAVLQGVAAPSLIRQEKQEIFEARIKSWYTLPENILPHVKQTPKIAVFATRPEVDLNLFGCTESLGLYDQKRIATIVVAMRILLMRSDSLRPSIGISFSTTHPEVSNLVKRVAKPGEYNRADPSNISNVVAEGFVSIAQAVPFVEIDSFIHGSSLLDTDSLKLRTRRLVPQMLTGYFGEMCLRGMYFEGLFHRNNTISTKHQKFFEHLRNSYTPKSKGFIPANDGEGCPAMRKSEIHAHPALQRMSGIFYDVLEQVADHATDVTFIPADT